MKSRTSLLLLAGVFSCHARSAAQELIYSFAVEGVACGSVLAGEPGTTARLQVTVNLETEIPGIMTWFIAVGGEGGAISFGSNGCRESCLAARLGKPVQAAVDFIVDPILIPRTGPLAGKPQGPGVIAVAALYPLTLDPGMYEILQFPVDVTFPPAGKEEEVRLSFKDGLSHRDVSKPVENSVQVLGPWKPPVELSCSFVLLSRGAPRFIRGDCNGDGDASGVTDAVVILTNLFLGSVDFPCLAACDVDGDGSSSSLADAITLLSRNFLGGPALAQPYPACGPWSLPHDPRLGCRRPPDECR
jgi:hypothetical protein